MKAIITSSLSTKKKQDALLAFASVLEGHNLLRLCETSLSLLVSSWFGCVLFSTLLSIVLF